MALETKKRSRGTPQASGPVIACAGYRLAVKNDDETIRWQLWAWDKNGREYRLFVPSGDPRIPLLKKITRKIATDWPDCGWRFRADKDGIITEVL